MVGLHVFPSTTAVLAKAMLKWPFCFCYGLNACVPHNSQVEVLRMVLGVGLWAVLRSWAASGMRSVTLSEARERWFPVHHVRTHTYR